MTILGQETVEELRDLVKAKDAAIAQIQAARDAFHWPDAAAAADWDRDWTVLRAKYLAAKALAASAFSRAAFMIGVRDSVIPAPIEYDAVLKAIRHTDGVQTKGDLQELSDRLTAAQGHGIDFKKTPQPVAQDVDLEVYKAADTTLKKGEKAAQDWLPWAVGGGLALLGLALVTRR